jgi:hypothetical protein
MSVFSVVQGPVVCVVLRVVLRSLDNHLYTLVYDLLTFFFNLQLSPFES